MSTAGLAETASNAERVPGSAGTVIQLRGIEKIYRTGGEELRALDGVDLTIENGEFVAVMGPSGSGKSTLMNIIGCMDRPTSGTCAIDGIDVATLDANDRAEISNGKIGFVFQSFNLLPRTTAIENAELPLLYAKYGFTARERRAKAHEAIARVGLEGLEEHEPSKLSGGQQQRVAIARALITDPSIILADEPTGNLDSRSSQDIMALLQKLNDAGRTIMVITHEPDVARYASRVVRIRDGRIVSDERQEPFRQKTAPEATVAAPERRTVPHGTVVRASVQRLFSTIRVGTAAISRNVLRSVLTMLGIVIGVGCVIVVLAIGSGAAKSVASMIGSLGSNLIMIHPGAATQSGVRFVGGQVNLVPADADAIRAECPAVAYVSAGTRSGAQAVAGELNWGTQVYGAGVDWPRIRSWNVAHGEFFTDAEERAAAKVCVLGDTVAANLFPNRSDAVGSIVRIKNVPFRVVGVLERKGGNLMGSDQDDQIIVPYTTSLKRLIGRTNISVIYASAVSEAQMAEAKRQIDGLLRQRHRIQAGGESDFHIFSQDEIASAAAAQMNTLRLLLLVIATVSLLVGGIGIMNVMLASVMQRTREIGLRIAVGAKRRQVMLQFLFEAAALTVAGGAIGALLGWVASAIVGRTTGWPIAVSVSSLALSFAVAAAVGVFFGFYPARRACRLDPIQALRYE